MIRFLNPLQWMKWFGEFVSAWMISIPWASVLAGVPAIVLTLGLGLLAFLSYSDGGAWRKGLVESQIERAYRAEDFETAELLIRRQIEEGDPSSTSLYQLAVARNQQNETEEAIFLMRQLVGSRRDGKAAMWLVKELYLGKKWTDLDADEQVEFGQLLSLLADENPNDMGIEQLYADYLIANGQFEAAIPRVRQLAEAQPMRGLQAAALARQTGDEELAIRLASETLNRIQIRFKEEPANPSLALATVQTQVFLEKHADAVRLLNDSIPRMKKDEHRQALRQAMGDTIANWITLIEQQKNETPVERMRVLKMLQVALQFAPNNPRVLTLVADQVLRTIDNQDDEIQSLRETLVQGTSPGISHFVRGTAGLMANDNETAERHLTLAAKHLPNSSAILNNLAVSIAQREDGDLDRALALSEKAIATMENPGPYFYETRGQILFRMKRYLDAIPDLERALAVEPLAGKAHESLAVCYEQLNEPELAADHRAAADRYRTPVGL